MAVAQVFHNIFVWNLTTPVGAGQPNQLADVELVRFGYHMMRSARDIDKATPALRDALQGMRRTGGFDQDLDAVIRAHQQQKRTPVDGKVSVAHITSANRGRYDSTHPWLIVLLNNFMRDFDRYPRIDLHPDSGFEISRVAATLRNA